MQVKKIGLGIGGLLLLCYLYTWCKYDFFYQEYDPVKMEQQFKDKKLRVPIYDTLRVSNLKIGYLSNKRERYVEGYDYLGGVRNPYLILIPENGDNITRFLPYFLDEELMSKYHIIAIDRIGFGGSKVGKNANGEPFGYYDNRKSFEESAIYALLSMADRITDSEGKYLDEGRVIFGGSTAVVGLGAAYNTSLSSNKTLLLNANLTPRWMGSKGYSTFVVSGIGRAFFPANYVSKHQDLIFADQVLDNYMTNWIEGVKYTEDTENNNVYSMYQSASEGGMSKVLFFTGLSKSDTKKVNDLTGGGNFGLFEPSVDLYQPQEVMKVLKEADRYTLEFNRISK
ncbi:hypothetical protein ACPDHL_07825 [Myroides sp. C15-4]|uniref:hypothetical protein n=1 Tax=Myroides sp. C15-4 TaxID=3400532 RepID=UPI003D2F876B